MKAPSEYVIIRKILGVLKEEHYAEKSVGG